jgi:hypothetical protein
VCQEQAVEKIAMSARITDKSGLWLFSKVTLLQ